MSRGTIKAQRGIPASNMKSFSKINFVLKNPSQVTGIMSLRRPDIIPRAPRPCWRVLRAGKVEISRLKCPKFSAGRPSWASRCSLKRQVSTRVRPPDRRPETSENLVRPSVATTRRPRPSTLQFTFATRLGSVCSLLTLTAGSKRLRTALRYIWAIYRLSYRCYSANANFLIAVNWQLGAMQ
jgi:hypothetical protein